MREDATKGDRGADERVEFFVSADSELQVAGGDALDFEVLGGVLGTKLASRRLGRGWVTHSCELENFSGQVFEDGGNVDGSLGSNAHLILGVVLQETLDTTAGELKNGC